MVRSLLQLSMLASLLVAALGLRVVPTSPVRCSHYAPAAAPLACSVRMADDAVAEAAPADGSFTEDLLDALAADEAPLEGSTASLDGAPPLSLSFDDVTLEPKQSYTNYKAVEDIRAKYKVHENDTGSATVQVAVLTARITYMTAHMQQNKKDYASLRGLTKMVTRRRKLLEYMLKNDREEFKRVTSELGIRTNKLTKPKLRGARGRRV